MRTMQDDRRRGGPALALVGAALAVALGVMGAVAPAGPAAAAPPGPDQLGRVCPPSSPNCSPELAAGALPGPETLRGCPVGQPSCSPETVAGGGGSPSGYGGLGPAAIGGPCRPSAPNCRPE